MHVIVIGVGIVGAAVAEALAARGARVTALDSRSPGRGASQASAGILAPYTEAQDKGPLLDLGRRSLARYDAFVAGVRERSGLAFHYARSGTLEIATDDAGASRLEGARSWLVQADVDHQWLVGSEIAAVEPAVSTDAVAGLAIPDHGFVDVPGLVSGLVQSARLSGAVFEAPVDVEAVEDRGGAVLVRAGARTYEADAAVLAAGSWAGRVRLGRAGRCAVRPIRGQLLCLRWPEDSRPARVVWGDDCYVVPRADGTVLVGATVEDAGFDESATVAGVESLTRAATALLPSAAAARLEAVRVGLRPKAADGLPAIGRLAQAPRVVVATGHYRNGILLAPLTADLVAGLLLDDRDDPALTVTDPGRLTG